MTICVLRSLCNYIDRLRVINLYINCAGEQQDRSTCEMPKCH